MNKAFPVLSDPEIDLLEPFAVCESYEDGEEVFVVGQASISMFVVVNGKLEVLNPHDSNAHVRTHLPGEFTGDIDLVTERPVIVSGFARGDTKLLRISNENLRRILNKLPSISEKILTAFRHRRDLLSAQSDRIGLKIIGVKDCSRTNLVREFLYRNFIPFAFYDAADLDVLAKFNRQFNLFPVVECPDGTFLENPSLRELAKGIGAWKECQNQQVDFAIIGAGPSGLAAAVYAASEGLSTLVIDKVGPGGQAGGSSKIENFIGFPSGLSGMELATRGILQMLKFGARLIAPVEVCSLSASGNGIEIQLDCGSVVHAKTILLATGVKWRKLKAKNADKFERAGIHYACTNVEAIGYENCDVAVVGAGNSAGQAAMYLAECCPSRKVHMIVRNKLGPSMSEYLMTRIASNPTIVVHEQAQIEEILGANKVESIKIVSASTQMEILPVAAVFVFIGAEPTGAWLPDSIVKDKLGYVLAGRDVEKSGNWPLTSRTPCSLETSLPNVLVAGDLRSGSTKRVGFAVGDGAQSVSCAHDLMSYRAADEKSGTQ